MARKVKFEISSDQKKRQRYRPGMSVTDFTSKLTKTAKWSKLKWSKLLL